jgi:hypothetical protein
VTARRDVRSTVLATALPGPAGTNTSLRPVSSPSRERALTMHTAARSGCLRTTWNVTSTVPSSITRNAVWRPSIGGDPRLRNPATAIAVASASTATSSNAGSQRGLRREP